MSRAPVTKVGTDTSAVATDTEAISMAPPGFVADAMPIAHPSVTARMRLTSPSVTETGSVSPIISFTDLSMYL